MKNLLQRTVSGIIYLVLIIGSLFLGGYAFGTVFLVIGLLALSEFYQLAGFSRFSHNAFTGLISGSVIFILAYITASGIIGLEFLVLAIAIPVVALIPALYLKKSDYLAGLSTTLFGLVYIFVPLAGSCFLVFTPADGYTFTHRILLGMLILVWLNDTAAYVTGTAFGRHKLFPRISPKKSWEGLAGGTLLTLLAAFWMDKFTGILITADWLVLAAIVSVLGVFGDLVESMIKRKADVKDSGNLIPGHGGVLDRIDSILFVIPVSLIYLVLKGI